MEITFTTKQKQELKIQHDTTRDGLVCDPLKTVIQASNGWGTEEITGAFFIPETTVRQYTLVTIAFTMSYSLVTIMWAFL